MTTKQYIKILPRHSARSHQGHSMTWRGEPTQPASPPTMAEDPWGMAGLCVFSEKCKIKKYKKENTGAPKKRLSETAEPCSWSSIQACNCAPDLCIETGSPILEGIIASLGAQCSAVSKKVTNTNMPTLITRTKSMEKFDGEWLTL